MTCCPGPLVWFEAPPSPAEADNGVLLAAILECARCDYLIVTGTFHDAAHVNTPLLMEGLAA